MRRQLANSVPRSQVMVLTSCGGKEMCIRDSLWGMNVSAGIAERGHNYYTESRVRYISLDGSKGYAIVEGSTA